MTSSKTIINWAMTLYLVLEKKSEKEKNEILKKLQNILKEKKQEHLLPKILAIKDSIEQKKKKIVFTFARKECINLAKDLKEKFPEVFQESKNTEIKIDDELIGGFRIKSENILIKVSIKDFLEELKNLYVRY